MELLTTYSIPVSITLRVLSCIILIFFCIPLQIKEAKVANGLRLLRIQLLVFGLILLFTNFVSLIFLFDGLSIPQRPLNSALQIINAVCFFTLALIGYRIYRTQYTEPIKKAHRKLEKIKKEMGVTDNPKF